MAKRTLSRKDGTVWTEAGMWSPKSFERLRPQLQPQLTGSGSGPEFNVPTIPAPPPTQRKMAPSSGGPDSGSRYLDYGIFVRLRC